MRYNNGKKQPRGGIMMVFIYEDSWFIEVGELSICNVNGWWVGME
jgi:hypothetical protein